MSEKIIEAIGHGWGPDSNYFRVGGTYGGSKVITKIVPAYKNGEMAMITYYEIWCGDELVSELHDYSFVDYKQEVKP